MYMHQLRLRFVLTSNARGRLHREFSFTTPEVTALLAVAPPSRGVTARLVEQSLGSEASAYYRSPARSFPLQYQGRFFSVSHAAGMAAVAVSATPIGVDVERRLSRDAAIDLDWALTEDERAELAGGGKDRLTEIWTTKEASSKALGVGLSPTPKRLSTRLAAHVPRLRTCEVPLPSSTAQVLTFGLWFGDQHLRLAWPTPANPAASPLTADLVVPSARSCG